MLRYDRTNLAEVFSSRCCPSTEAPSLRILSLEDAQVQRPFIAISSESYPNSLLSSLETENSLPYINRYHLAFRYKSRPRDSRGSASHSILDNIEYICQTMTRSILVSKPHIIRLRHIVNTSRSSSPHQSIGMEIGRVTNAREKILIRDKVKPREVQKIRGSKKQIQYMISSKQHKQRLMYVVSFSCPRQRLGGYVLNMISSR